MLYFLLQPSGRRSNGSRASSASLRDRDKRRGQTQVHGLGPTPVEPLRKIEEDSMPKVEEVSMGGWMTCDFTSFLTVFQSYQDDVWMIMKAVCNGTLFRVEEKISPRVRIELGPLDQ